MLRAHLCRAKGVPLAGIADLSEKPDKQEPCKRLDSHYPNQLPWLRSGKAQREGVSRHVYRSASVESWELPHQRPQLRLRQADGQLGGFRPERHEVQKHRAGGEPGASGSWTTRYDYVGLVSIPARLADLPTPFLFDRLPPDLKAVSCDGINEKGLSAAALWNDDADFPDAAGQPADTRLLADFNVVEWLLGNFATVEEIRTGDYRLAADRDLGAGRFLRAFLEAAAFPLCRPRCGRQ